MQTDVRELDEVEAAIRDGWRHVWPPDGLDDPDDARRLRRRLVHAAGRRERRLITRVTYEQGKYRVAFIVKQEDEQQ